MLSQSFAYGWRFMDPKFRQLPPEDLSLITELPQEESAVLWEKNVVRNSSHLLRPGAEMVGARLDRFRVDFDREEDTRQLLALKVPLPFAETIEFLWGPRHAVRSQWGVFLKYWSDFFYPDDDNDALLIRRIDTTLVLCEEFVNNYRVHRT
jgi:hypothetical protein